MPSHIASRSRNSVYTYKIICLFVNKQSWPSSGPLLPHEILWRDISFTDVFISLCQRVEINMSNVSIAFSTIEMICGLYSKDFVSIHCACQKLEIVYYYIIQPRIILMNKLNTQERY